MESRLKHPAAFFTQRNVAIHALMAVTQNANGPAWTVFDAPPRARQGEQHD
jgi:hypothetical protein